MVLHLGPVSFPIFGILVATGVMVGHALVLRLAAQRRVPLEEMRNAAAWAIGAGFFGAHLFDVFFYHPEKLSRDGVLALFKVWDGISSFGGFFGALAGVAFYFARLGKPWWVHADMLIQGLIAGWVFGRLGCTLTSDHVGHLSSFALAFDYPTGARHNVGFYEFVYTVAVLVPAMWLLRWRERTTGYRPGIYIAVASLLYAPARFLLDFLRATDLANSDPRFFGLTGGQYASVAVFVTAMWLLRRISRAPAENPGQTPFSAGTGG
ncbi:MAG: prolipoprotein diacylglyceryl transferase [Candidatus Binatia bacterium]